MGKVRLLWIMEEEFGKAKRGVSQTFSDSCNDHRAWILIFIFIFIFFFIISIQLQINNNMKAVRLSIWYPNPVDKLLAHFHLFIWFSCYNICLLVQKKKLNTSTYWDFHQNENKPALNATSPLPFSQALSSHGMQLQVSTMECAKLFILLSSVRL